MQSTEGKPRKMWKTKSHKEINIEKPILIEGLPGIGNVGKVVVDYLVEQNKAELYKSFFSYDLPNTVFVNQENLVELPKIELYHKKINGKDYLFLAGEVQPKTERSSYQFTEEILKIANKHETKEIITLGGIGLNESQSEPKIYCTGNNKEIIKKFTDEGARDDIYGVVGPILGVTGLLIGMSEEYDIKSSTLLVETYNNPMYLGLKEAKVMLELLNKTYDLKVNFKELEREISQETEEETSVSKNLRRVKETNYIG